MNHSTELYPAQMAAKDDRRPDATTAERRSAPFPPAHQAHLAIEYPLPWWPPSRHYTSRHHQREHPAPHEVESNCVAHLSYPVSLFSAVHLVRCPKKLW